MVNVLNWTHFTMDIMPHAFFSSVVGSICLHYRCQFFILFFRSLLGLSSFHHQMQPCFNHQANQCLPPSLSDPYYDDDDDSYHYYSCETLLGGLKITHSYPPRDPKAELCSHQLVLWRIKKRSAPAILEPCIPAPMMQLLSMSHHLYTTMGKIPLLFLIILIV